MSDLQAITSKAATMRRVQEIISEHPQDQEFSAREILQQEPEIQTCRSAAIDLIYEEWLLRCEQDCPPPLSDFVAQFPGFEHTIMALLQVDENLQQHPSLLEQFAKPDWPHRGDVFLGFELVELLGQGALSRVYLAKQREVANRLVIAKICLRGDFEAQFLGRFDHPSIETIFSINDDPDSALSVLCMPFHSRSTLDEVITSTFSSDARPKFARELLLLLREKNEQINADIKDVRLPPKSQTWADGVIGLGIQISEGLQHAHERNVLHCDVKPSNIVLTRNAEVKLIDFNLSAQDIDTTTNIGGTLPYMAPEQLAQLPGLVGKGESDPCPSFQRFKEAELAHTTDVFQVGGTLFHAATGELPFGPVDQTGQKAAAREQLKRIAEGPRDPQEIDPAISDEFAQLLRDCLSFEMSDRPQSAAELKRRLVALQPARSIFASRRFLVVVGWLVSACLLASVGIKLMQPSPYVKGMRAFDNREYGKALGYFNESIAAGLDVDLALFARGRLHIQQRRFLPAVKDLEKVDHLSAAKAGRGFAIYQHEYVVRNIKDGRTLKSRRDAMLYAEELFKDAFEAGCVTTEIEMNLLVFERMSKFSRMPDGFVKKLKEFAAPPFSLVSAKYELANYTARAVARNPEPIETKYIDWLVEFWPSHPQICLLATKTYGRLAFEAQGEERHRLAKLSLSYAEMAYNAGIKVRRIFTSRNGLRASIPEYDEVAKSYLDRPQLPCSEPLDIRIMNPFGPDGNDISQFDL